MASGGGRNPYTWSQGGEKKEEETQSCFGRRTTIPWSHSIAKREEFTTWKLMNRHLVAKCILHLLLVFLYSCVRGFLSYLLYGFHSKLCVYTVVELTCRLFWNQRAGGRCESRCPPRVQTSERGALRKPVPASLSVMEKTRRKWKIEIKNTWWFN